MFYKNFKIEKCDEVEGIFEGTLVKYGNRDRQGDIILPKACSSSIERWRNLEKNIPALYEHNKNIIIAGNMMNIWEYENEVCISFRASEDFKKNYATEFNAMIDAYRDGKAFFSVGMSAKGTSYHKVDKTDNGMYVRYIFDKVDIMEGSFTTSPANPMAKVQYMKSMEDVENLLKNVNSFSRAEEFLRKNSDLTTKQRTDFLKSFEKICIQKSQNSSPAQDCLTNEPAQVHHNDAFMSEIEKLFNQKNN